MELPPESARALLELARSAIRASLRRLPMPPPAPDPHLRQRAGCFVSLHDRRSHRLRGCVGRMEADEPLASLVPQVAVSCLHDPRFEAARIVPNDLPGLEIEVTVLSPLRDARDPLDFDPATEGILLQIDQHSGCFLPQVAEETGWGREQLLARLCTEKLDLPADAWRRADAQLRAFTAQIIGPEPFEADYA